MKYNGTVYRPTAEANTFLIPATEGCTHNSCRFCNMFRGVPFRMVDLNEAEEYLAQQARLCHDAGREIPRAFLVGADPFALSAGRLLRFTDLVRKYLPECGILSMYAAVRNVETKSDEDLKTLRQAGINELYVGIESALDDVLEYFNKGHTVEQAEEQMLRLNEAGIRHRDMIIPGAAGKGRGEESGLAFARLFTVTKPDMILFTAMSFFPGTGLYDDMKAGLFVPAGEKEVLQEEKILIENMDSPETFLWSVHSLNSVHLTGRVGENKEEMVRRLDRVIGSLDEKRFRETFRREHL